MVYYPISVPRDRYNGRDDRRRIKAQRYNQVAQMCEDYLNRKIQESSHEIQQYFYRSIALDLNLEANEVENVLNGVGGGNGLTVRKCLST